MMHRLSAIAAAALLLGACNGTTKAMNSWMGETDTAVLTAWGTPDLETTSSDGSRHLTWVRRARSTGQEVCRQSLTVSPQHRIVGGMNGCPG